MGFEILLEFGAWNFRYNGCMWPFPRRHRRKRISRLEKLVAGIVIGGAIGSIVGKKLMDRANGDDHDEDENEEDFEESDEE